MFRLKSCIFIIICFIVSCKYGSKKNTKWRNDYNKSLKTYPSKLTTHFPVKSKIKNNYTSYIYTSSKYSPALLIIQQNETKNVIDSLINKGKLLDPPFYIVNKYLRDATILSFDENYDKYETQKYIERAFPVPNFYEINEFDENSYNYLKKGYKIYLLAAKDSKCCADKFHRGDWHMPEKWKDGYSRGYAINLNNNSVIYWLVIW